MNEIENLSDDYILEHAYLVERGVRHMAIVGHVKGDNQTILEVESRLSIVAINSKAIPFIILRSDGIADCGYAKAAWVISLYQWLVQSPSIPEKHQHRIRGMLLGYDSNSIREHEERYLGTEV